MLGQRGDVTIEDEVFRRLVQELVVALGEKARRSERFFGVDLALHHVELVIHRGEAAFRLHEDEAVHAVRDMLGDGRDCAVIDVEAGVERLEGDGLLLSGRRARGAGAAARPGRRVEVDVVHHRAVFVVLQVHFDVVADANANERTGDPPVEGPESVSGIAVETRLQLHGLEIDAHLFGPGSLDRRRKVGRIMGDVRHPLELVHVVEAAAATGRCRGGRHVHVV